MASTSEDIIMNLLTTPDTTTGGNNGPIEPIPEPAQGVSTGTSKDKRKRRNTPTPPPTSSPAKKPRNNTSNANDAPAPTADVSPGKWAISRNKVGQMTWTKRALELHIRMLWGCITETSLPPTVSDTDKIPFNNRYASGNELNQSVSASLHVNAGQLDNAEVRAKRILNSIPIATTSVLANNLRRIPEACVVQSYQAVAEKGLHRWAPDLKGGVESAYNQIHEAIALTTFEQVATALGYSHMRVNLQHIKQRGAMKHLYRNFVFGYMLGLAKSEAKKAGAVEHNAEKAKVYKRRDKLGSRRRGILLGQFRQATRDLAAANEAHSEDEEDPETGNYIIYAKEERNPNVSDFFHNIIDPKAARVSQSKRTGAKFRTRVAVENPLKARFTTLPKDIPVDYFSPTYWNDEMTLRERADVIADGIRIALPLPKFCTSWKDCEEWARMPDEDFMKKYGDDVLKQYRIPTEAELEELAELEGSEESDDE